MKLTEYQDLAARTIPQNKDHLDRKKEFITGLCEESGEVAGVLKKVLYHDHPLTVEKLQSLIDELGDVMWHIAAVATEFDLSLEDIADYNVNVKLKKRYKNGFSNEASRNR